MCDNFLIARINCVTLKAIKLIALSLSFEVQLTMSSIKHLHWKLNLIFLVISLVLTSANSAQLSNEFQNQLEISSKETYVYHDDTHDDENTMTESVVQIINSILSVDTEPVLESNFNTKFVSSNNYAEKNANDLAEWNKVS